jgi:hypothetical protein
MFSVCSFAASCNREVSLKLLTNETLAGIGAIFTLARLHARDPAEGSTSLYHLPFTHRELSRRFLSSCTASLDTWAHHARLQSRRRLKIVRNPHFPGCLCVHISSPSSTEIHARWSQRVESGCFFFQMLSLNIPSFRNRRRLLSRNTQKIRKTSLQDCLGGPPATYLSRSLSASGFRFF